MKDDAYREVKYVEKLGVFEAIVGKHKGEKVSYTKDENVDNYIYQLTDDGKLKIVASFCEPLGRITGIEDGELWFEYIIDD